jgi:hypothetical protein
VRRAALQTLHLVLNLSAAVERALEERRDQLELPRQHESPEHFQPVPAGAKPETAPEIRKRQHREMLWLVSTFQAPPPG